MPVYEISTTCLILADDEEEARLGFATYVGGDLGIECFEAKEEQSDQELKEEITKLGFEPSDYYDYVSGHNAIELKEELEEIFEKKQDEKNKDN